MPAPARFCAIWMVSLCAIFSMVVAINVVIDPYDVVGAPRIAGLNKFKVTAPRHTQLTKEYQLGRVQPRTVLLGSSGVDIGLDPESTIWPMGMRPIYNFGVPGISLYGMLLNLRMAASTGRLQYAFVGLDLENFIGSDDSTADEYEVLLTNERSSLGHIRDLARSTFSYSALVDSIETVVAQYRRMPLDLGTSGGTNEGGFVATASSDGEYVLFAQKHAEYTQRFRRMAQMHGQSGGAFANTATLRAIISFCDAHGIALTLLILPSHADRYDVLDDAGLWPVHEAWKAEIAGITHGQDKRSTRVWDFSGYNAYTTEPVPAKGDVKAMTTWFWEPGHFKRALGERMLTRMLTGQPSDLGVLLTTDRIGDQLEADRKALVTYRCQRNATPSDASRCEHGG